MVKLINNTYRNIHQQNNSINYESNQKNICNKVENILKSLKGQGLDDKEYCYLSSKLRKYITHYCSSVDALLYKVKGINTSKLNIEYNEIKSILTKMEVKNSKTYCLEILTNSKYY